MEPHLESLLSAIAGTGFGSSICIFFLKYFSKEFLYNIKKAIEAVRQLEIKIAVLSTHMEENVHDKKMLQDHDREIAAMKAQIHAYGQTKFNSTRNGKSKNFGV